MEFIFKRTKTNLKLLLVVITLIFVSAPIVKSQIMDGGELENVTIRCWTEWRVSISVGYKFVSVSAFDIVRFVCDNGYSGFYIDY